MAACLSKYGTFSGRAGRAEFWWFQLFLLLLSWAASLAGTVSDGYEAGQALSGILSLAFFVPSLAVGARRLHDCGRSGWWQLLILTVIGIILLLIWWATEGSSEENEYGTGLD
ncbi:MAG: DUF805 domain-containing protein [Myxococcota bacterium]